MFVIKNIKRDYDCYLTKDNTWKGLLEAETFKTEEEAEIKLTEEGKIIDWNEITGLNK